MSWVFYHQRTPESAWEVADAKDRKRIIEENQPPFTTILDLSSEILDEMSKEEIDQVYYRGDLYFDFDSDDIEECIPQFNKFLGNLTEIGIDLRQVELYASGGKGFHIIIPMKIFIAKPNSAGYRHLPQIYKEVAQALYVDCLDMRVYSARKGRMFRTVNVLRSNGKYKVPLGVVEARQITPEAYEEYTSAPRQMFQIEPPVLNDELARIFSDAREKVNKAVQQRKSSKADDRLLEKFGKDLPDSVKMIGRGENIREGAGFQNIATQIAITANALGLTEAQTLESCEGVIANHQSDGFRYNTPAKRRKEISRMYHYMQDNPCYEFSAGAIKSVLVQGTPTPDLDPPIDDPHGALDEDEELGLDDYLTKGVRFNKNGIFLKIWSKEEKAHYLVKCSDVGIDEVAMLRDLETGENVGYEYSAYLNGVPRGRRKVTMSSINSAHMLQTAVGNPEGAAIQVNDAQAKAFLDLMRKKAEARNAVVTSVPREGVDIINLPDTDKETGRFEIIYAGPKSFGVITETGDADQYRLQTVNGIDGELKSDLLGADRLKGCALEQEFFDRFFTLQPKEVASRTIGYYLASFLAQVIRREFRQFPVLQVFGEAGAGKTAYNTLCSNLHYYNKIPAIWAANSVTPFALTTLLQSSGSIPIVFDEMKTRELGLRRSQEFLMVIRNNYTGNSGGKGRVNRDAGASTLSIDQNANVAPLVFLSEEMETQTAVMDRSVLVSMVEKQNKDENGSFNFCLRNRRILGKFGRLCVHKVLGLNIEAMRAEMEDYRVLLEEAAGRAASARPIFNNSVILLGLEFGKIVLGTIFNDRYDSVLEEYKNEVLGNVALSIPTNKSEVNKVLDTLAYLSGRSDHDPLQLHHGEDYILALDKVTGEPCVDIHLKNCWDKYSRYRRSQGEQPLYNSEGAFINAIQRHRASFDSVCVDSELKGGRPSVQVTRLSLRILYDDEQVEEFNHLSKKSILNG